MRGSPIPRRLRPSFQNSRNRRSVEQGSVWRTFEGVSATTLTTIQSQNSRAKSSRLFLEISIAERETCAEKWGSILAIVQWNDNIKNQLIRKRCTLQNHRRYKIFSVLRAWELGVKIIPFTGSTGMKRRTVVFGIESITFMVPALFWMISPVCTK